MKRSCRAETKRKNRISRLWIHRTVVYAIWCGVPHEMMLRAYRVLFLRNRTKTSSKQQTVKNEKSIQIGYTRVQGTRPASSLLSFAAFRYHIVSNLLRGPTAIKKNRTRHTGRPQRRTENDSTEWNEKSLIRKHKQYVHQKVCARRWSKCGYFGRFRLRRLFVLGAHILLGRRSAPSEAYL